MIRIMHRWINSKGNDYYEKLFSVCNDFNSSAGVFAGCGGSEESSNNTHDAVNISDGTNADDLSSTDDSASQGSENNLF